MSLLVKSEGPDQTTEAQANLGLHYPHIPEDTFLHGRAQIIGHHNSLSPGDV